MGTRVRAKRASLFLDASAPASSCRTEAGRPICDSRTPTVGSGARGSSIHGAFSLSSNKILFGGGWCHRLLVKRLLGIIAVDDRWRGVGASDFVTDVFTRRVRASSSSASTLARCASLYGFGRSAELGSSHDSCDNRMHDHVRDTMLAWVR